MAKYSNRELSVSIKNKSIDRVIKNLNIKVVASKTISANPNQATIEIYNLNQNSREELFNNVYDLDKNEANTEIIVSLDGRVLFQGQLVNVNSIFSTGAAEWKTILFCGDGFNAARQKIQKKYAKGTKLTDIEADMMKEWEKTGAIIKGLFEGLNDCAKGRSLVKAIVINGTYAKNFQNLFQNCFTSVDVYVDEGKLNRLADGAIIPNNKVIINKGLIEPPTLSEQGINCKVVINSSIKIGAEIQVEARSVNVSYGNLTVYRPNKTRISGDGIYRVQEIKHSVDNFSQEVATTEIIGINTRGNFGN